MSDPKSRLGEIAKQWSIIAESEGLTKTQRRVAEARAESADRFAEALDG